jgi:hypothetical protein
MTSRAGGREEVHPGYQQPGQHSTLPREAVTQVAVFGGWEKN